MTWKYSVVALLAAGTLALTMASAVHGGSPGVAAAQPASQTAVFAVS